MNNHFAIPFFGYNTNKLQPNPTSFIRHRVYWPQEPHDVIDLDPFFVVACGESKNDVPRDEEGLVATAIE